MNYNDLIWDFNGTLLDDVEVCLTCTDILLRERGHTPLSTKQRYREVFGFPIIDYYRRAGFDFTREPYLTVADQWVALYQQNYREAVLYDGTQEVLSYFAQKGIRQTILSASETDMLNRQVEELGIRPYFTELLGLGDVYANSKKALGIAWKRAHPDAVALFVGDTEHDAETAEAMGVDCVLIAAGHRKKEDLLKTGRPVLDSIRELPAYVNSKDSGI